MTGRSEGYHAALASTSRRQVLDALLAAPEPLDAAAVADQLGLHVTTARFHLDQLTGAGLAQRRTGTPKRRGRPRMLYSPAGAARDDDAREQLIEVLAATIAREENPAADATSAGRRWADTFDAPDPEHPVPALVEVLDRIGFAPEPAPGAAQTILLHACPFREAAREHPEVVCAVHRGLVERLLENTGPPAQLVPFVEPDLCVITLDLSRAVPSHRSPPAAAP